MQNLRKTIDSKQTKIVLLEYAVVYKDQEILSLLRKKGFKATRNPEKNWLLIKNKYFVGYSNNFNSVLNKANQYGINFRNQFNFTPLMMAAYFGNHELANQLCELGADKYLTDNHGRNALQIALSASTQPNNQKKLAKLYDILASDHLSIKPHDKLIKLDSKHMEFFLLNIVISIFNEKRLLCTKGNQPMCIAFTANYFATLVQDLPHSVLMERRKNRNYISSILSKNEMHRDGPYNRCLFLRMSRGKYTINPNLAIKVSGKWFNIYSLINCESIKPGQSATTELLNVFSA